MENQALIFIPDISGFTKFVTRDMGNVGEKLKRLCD